MKWGRKYSCSSRSSSVNWTLAICAVIAIWKRRTCPSLLRVLLLLVQISFGVRKNSLFSFQIQNIVMLDRIIHIRGLEPSIIFIWYAKLWRSASLLTLNFNFFKRFWFLSVLESSAIHFLFTILVIKVFNCLTLHSLEWFKFLRIMGLQTLIILTVLEHPLSFLMCQGFLVLQLHKDLVRDISCLRREDSIILFYKYLFFYVIKRWVVYFNDVSVCFSTRWNCFSNWRALIHPRNIPSKYNMLGSSRFRSQRLSGRCFVRSVCQLCSCCIVQRLRLFPFNIPFSQIVSGWSGVASTKYLVVIQRTDRYKLNAIVTVWVESNYRLQFVWINACNLSDHTHFHILGIIFGDCDVRRWVVFFVTH